MTVTALEGIRCMLAASGMTPYRVSLTLGRSPNYVSGMLRRGSVPSADLLARVAGACGYDLVLAPRTGEGSPLVLTAHD